MPEDHVTRSVREREKYSVVVLMGLFSFLKGETNFLGITHTPDTNSNDIHPHRWTSRCSSHCEFWVIVPGLLDPKGMTVGLTCWLSRPVVLHLKYV